MRQLIVLVVIVAPSLGCAAPSPRPVPAPEPGVLTVSLDDRLAWPYRLESLHVAIDGELFYRKLGGPFARGVASTSAAKGWHTVSVLADVSYATGAARDECVVRLRSSKSFDAPEGVGSVQVVAYLHDMTHDFVERPDLEFELRGVELGDEIYSTRFRRHPSSCPPIKGASDRICAAEERVRQAQEDRDIIAVTCYSEKLTQMRALATLVEDQREQVATGEDGEDAEHRRRVIATANARIEQLWEELEGCVCDGDPIAAYSPTARQVIGEGCRGTEPLDAETPSEGL